MVSIKRIIALSGVTAALGATGYALWFDYQRRNNAEFRKNLKQRTKKQKKQEELDAIEAKKARVSQVLHFLADELQNDPISTDPTQMEAVFTTNVELGERLALQPGNEIGAAVKFYKALAVYPKPADLLGIYQRTIPEAIYEYIVIMIAVIPPANITSFINNGADEGIAAAVGATVGEEEPLISELVPENLETAAIEKEEEEEEIVEEEKKEDTPVEEETSEENTVNEEEKEEQQEEEGEEEEHF